MRRANDLAGCPGRLVLERVNQLDGTVGADTFSTDGSELGAHYGH